MSGEVDGESISFSPSHLPQAPDNMISVRSKVSVKDSYWWLDVLAPWKFFSTIRLWECLSLAYEPSYLSTVLFLPTPLPGPAHPQYSCSNTSLLRREKKASGWEELICSIPALQGSLVRDEARATVRAGSTRESREHWAVQSRTVSGTQVPRTAPTPVRQCQDTGSNTIPPLFTNS